MEMTLVEPLHNTVYKIDEIVSSKEWYWPPNIEKGINNEWCIGRELGIPLYTEMEFLDTNLTKDLSILLRAIHSPFYCWRILKKIIFLSGFKNPLKKSANQENLSLVIDSIL
jgi:hypothetical protein